MPNAEEELAQIKAKLDKIQTKQYKEYAEKISSQLVNKNIPKLTKTKRNLEKKRRNLTQKQDTRQGVENKKKATNVGLLLDYVDDALKVEEVDSSSDEESVAEVKVEVENVISNNPLQIKSDCPTLFDPCSGEIITGENPLKIIQKKIATLQSNKRLQEYNIVPKQLRNGTRLDLLLWVLNNESFSKIEDLNEENLLNYKTETKISYSPDLFESYWDILLAMGFIDGFERKSNRFMYNGKIEELERIPSLDKGSEGDFIADPFLYLKGTPTNKKSIKTSNIGGASDITIFYKSIKSKIPKADPCSFEEVKIEEEKNDKPKFIFVSVKKFLKEKSIDKYDIMNIYGAAKKIPQDEINKEIILMVVNDEDVKKVKEGASRKYISEEASNVFGKSTMIAGLRKIYEFTSTIERPVTEAKLRKLFEDRKEEAMGGEEIADDRRIEPLNLLLHQRMTVRFISNAIREFYKKPTRNNRFLIGILPRGGKTFIAGGLISELKAKNIVVLLGAKSETQSQFIDELFYKYLNFNDYKIINVKDEKDDELKKGDLDLESKHIFVMSIELFKMDVALIENRPLLKLLRGLLPGKKSPIDLFISDEAHLKQATHKAEKAVSEAVYDEIDDSLSDSKFKSIPIVYMTGTFRKPKLAFEIPDEHTMIWDYEDVQRAKTLDENMDYFNNSFGYYFREALEHILLTSTNNSIDSIKQSYQNFPELHLMETHFFPGVEDTLLTQSDNKGIPTMNTLFELNKTHDFKLPNNWHLGFQFQNVMKRLINFLSPDESQVGIEEDKMSSVMTSIDRIAQRTGDRLKMVTSDFVVHSQLWFLPRMVGNPLGQRIMALTGTIIQNPWFRKNFNVFAVSGVDWKTYLSGIRHVESGVIDIEVGDEKGTFQYDISSGKSLKERVLDAEAKARKENKGLIILAQNMLQLGISLPCVSIVVLLDSGSDVDERIQKMYRALTQSPQKKDAFIVDLNYFRTIQAIVEYQIQAFKVRNKREAQKEDIQNIINKIFDIYSINDEKNLFAVKGKRDKEIEEIQSKLQEKNYKPLTDLKDGGEMMNKNINETINIDISLLSYLEPNKETDKQIRKQLIAKMKERLKKAKQLKENDNLDDSGDEETTNKEQIEESKKEQDDKISRAKAYLEIFKTLLRYGVFATENKTLAELKDNIKGDSETQDKIYDILLKRRLIKESLSKETLIHKIILPNLNKILENKKGQSFITMKGYVNDESKYPGQTAEVLDYINKHLAPKDIERQKYGEIYTPLRIVDEMLDSLPEDVWSNPNLKWLDPANGMGNFPIKVFLRLCEGLKSKMKDPAKHIVENMLFMIDINGKNNDIARKLFRQLAPDAKANIEKIDSEKGFFALKPLIFNGKKVNEFDIIMGNPPYNPPKTESGSSGNSIWQNFVIKSHSILNDKGYLLFIHPPGWKKPTDEIFKSEKFADGDYTKQIRQGQVWQILKDSGIFKFIYTNDQKSKAIGEDYIDYFPAVDYYLYQKGGNKSGCDTKNVFLGTIEEPKGVRLNYNLKYLPNLITKQTQDILHKITSKEGDKPDFGRGIDERGITWTGKSIDWLYDSNKSGFQYKKHGLNAFSKSGSAKDTVNINKVVVNFGGGINAYNVKYISKGEEIGVLDMTMYSKVESDKDGKQLEKFFKSDIVKFIFLITQYASGKMTKNEPLVANSITIPPEGTTDYYKFFGIEEHKKYIEELLAHYEKFKAPKRKDKTEKKGGNRLAPRRFTRKIRR